MSVALSKPRPSWSTVTTLKESLETTLNFVAHHLALGVDEMFLFFDDPDDPARAKLANHPKIRTFRCDDRHWARLGGRHHAQEYRQVDNAVLAYAATRSDWIAHIDGDELIQSDIPVPDLLSQVSADALRLTPWEILAPPTGDALSQETQYFKAPLPNTRIGRKAARRAFHPYAGCLKNGLLSHCWGKFFTRTGMQHVHLGIHVPYRNNQPIPAETTGDARLLHLHGGVFDEWAAQVGHRITRGAYNPRYQKKIIRKHGVEATLGHVLRRLSDEQGTDGLRSFHRAVCTLGPEKEELRDLDALFETGLDLDAKRARLLTELAH